MTTRTMGLKVSALSLAALLNAGCTIMCPCRNPPPGAATAALAGGAPPAAGVAAAGAPAKSVPYTWKNVAILGGGFVSGIVFSPIEKDLVYARTDVGGAYRFNPADKTWIPLTDFVARDSGSLGIESVAADPVDPNRVYMATGTYTGSW